MNEDARRRERNRLIAKIHVAKKQLGLSEDDYRQCLEETLGVRSCKEVAEPGDLLKIVHRLKQMGFGSKHRIQKPQKQKMQALWGRLYRLGAVREDSDAAIHCWVYRQTGVQRLQWLSTEQAQQCIEALKLWQRRIVEVEEDAEQRYYAAKAQAETERSGGASLPELPELPEPTKDPWED